MRRSGRIYNRSAGAVYAWRCGDVPMTVLVSEIRETLSKNPEFVEEGSAWDVDGVINSEGVSLIRCVKFVDPYRTRKASFLVGKGNYIITGLGLGLVKWPKPLFDAIHFESDRDSIHGIKILLGEKDEKENQV